MSESGTARSPVSVPAASTRLSRAAPSTLPSPRRSHRRSFLPSAVRRAERRGKYEEEETHRPFEDLSPEKPTRKKSSKWGRFRKLVFWTSCLLLVVLVVYLSLVYANDRKAQQKRDQRVNLKNYTQYAIAVSQELPHGHIVNPEEKRRIPKRIRSEWPRFKYDRDRPYMPESEEEDGV